MVTSSNIHDLEKPLLDSGIRSVNFFNGRLLTAHDLRREQEARHAADRWLGQALGNGVAYGLQVEKHPQSSPREPLVAVESGLAVNREGHALRLKARTTVALVRKAKKTALEDAVFAQCGNLQTGTSVVGAGVYLLTLVPARAAEGKAPTTGFDPFGGKCNTDAIVDTVQFRLLEGSLVGLGLALPGASVPEISRFRNALAHRCFGLTPPPAWVEAGAPAEFEELSALLGPGVLTPCDVPLALLYWTREQGIVFVDKWSVRRRIIRASAAAPWGMPADDWRLAAGEAMLLQFRDHLAAVIAPAGHIGSVSARDHFIHLPPAGILPLPGTGGVAAIAAIAKFFAGLTVRAPSIMEGARLEPLFRDSYAYPPIVLASGEMIWLFAVREALRKALPPPYLVFTTSHMPHPAGARFDAGRWDQSSFGLTC